MVWHEVLGMKLANILAHAPYKCIDMASECRERAHWHYSCTCMVLVDALSNLRCSAE
jgi:hypothetical protein